MASLLVLIYKQEINIRFSWSKTKFLFEPPIATNRCLKLKSEATELPEVSVCKILCQLDERFRRLASNYTIEKSAQSFLYNNEWER